jgi:hypothetical protein
VKNGQILNRTYAAEINFVHLQKRVTIMKRRFSKVMLAVIFLSVLTLVVMVTPLVKAQNVLLNPSSGAVGSSVTVTVSGFAANQALYVSFAGQSLTNGFEFETNSAGSGSETYTVPSVPAGPYSISVAGQSSGSASATFTVTASTSATATPTPSATASPTSTPKIPEFSNAALTLIVAAMAATTLCAAAYAKKRRRV